MFFGRSLLAAGALTVLAVAGSGVFDANAQQIFRIVGPDGRVTFSDKPPLDPGTRASPAKTVPLPGARGADTSALPFELRQAANRYPVTVYTAPDCAPCVAGRTMLTSRGIPFAERTVTTRDDIEALRRLAGSLSLPFLTIGGQQIKGYSETEWVQFLDAAGYPKTSQLPPGYAQAPAAPLVAAQEPRVARPAPAAPSPSEEAPAPPPAPAENPSGIRF
jgi:glutaredoxin